MHYFENVIGPNNQKSNCLFLNYLLFIIYLFIKGKMEHNKNKSRKGF